MVIDYDYRDNVDDGIGGGHGIGDEEDKDNDLRWW